MTDYYKLTLAFILPALFAVLIIGLTNKQQAYGSAPNGLQASVTNATTSQSTVGTTAIGLFATSTCSARVITTTSQPLMLTFSDNQGKVPTGSFGTWQSASTTVTYDSGQYGCGLVRGISYATGLVNLVETK